MKNIVLVYGGFVDGADPSKPGLNSPQIRFIVAPSR